MEAKEAVDKITEFIESARSVPIGDAEKLSDAQLAIRDLRGYINDVQNGEVRMTDSNDIGKMAKGARKRRNLSRKDVAAKAHVSPYIVEEWEKGYSDITVNEFLRITRAEKIDVAIRLPGEPFPDEI